ncbi:hypothetical protein LINPERHAP2_LOCUS28101 [Linum perenne]
MGISQQQIFCDGSFIVGSGVAGYGVVCINSQGQVTNGKAGTLVCSSSIVAEAKALLEALSMASASRVPTIVKSDCLNLVEALRDFRIAWPWECAAWLLSMKNILINCPWISVSFVPRRVNLAADWVAKSARNGSLPQEWTTCLSFLSMCNRL